jgi:queuine tRNA-ribosyltransferase
MFDCVLPTRNARHGILYTSEGVVNIKNAKWKEDLDPIDNNSTSLYSQMYTKAYLRHLFQAGEILALQIASLHNLSFFLWLVKQARVKIIEGNFLEWKNAMVVKLKTRL